MHPHTLLAVKRLTAGFKHHPINDAPLLAKCALCGRLPGALTKVNLGVANGGVTIPVVDAIECTFNMSESMELRSLVDVILHPDTASWITAVLAEIEAHLENSMWELAQLPPGRRAIRLHWVFKVKQKPDQLINKYQGCIVAQGFSQVQGIHYNETLASTALSSLDTVVHIWDIVMGTLLDCLCGHGNLVFSVAFTPNSKGLVSGSLHNMLKSLELNMAVNNTYKAGKWFSKSMLDFTGHKDYVLSIVILHDGQWVVSGLKDCGVRFWDKNGQAHLVSSVFSWM